MKCVVFFISHHLCRSMTQTKFMEKRGLFSHFYLIYLCILPLSTILTFDFEIASTLCHFLVFILLRVKKWFLFPVRKMCLYIPVYTTPFRIPTFLPGITMAYSNGPESMFTLFYFLHIKQFSFLLFIFTFTMQVYNMNNGDKIIWAGMNVYIFLVFKTLYSIYTCVYSNTILQAHINSDFLYSKQGSRNYIWVWCFYFLVKQMSGFSLWF